MEITSMYTFAAKETAITEEINTTIIMFII